MPLESPEATRLVRAAISRRYVDSTNLDIRVIHGTVYLRGILAKMRTHPNIDLEKEMEIITHSLRGKAGIREIIWEVNRRS